MVSNYHSTVLNVPEECWFHITIWWCRPWFGFEWSGSEWPGLVWSSSLLHMHI